MGDTIIGNDCFPVSAITLRLSPNPKSTTAPCKIFFDVKLMPELKISLSFMIKQSAIPMRIPNTGPPMIGNTFPKYQAGMEIPKHNKRPKPFSLAKFIYYSNSSPAQSSPDHSSSGQSSLMKIFFIM